MRLPALALTVLLSLFLQPSCASTSHTHGTETAATAAPDGDAPGAQKTDGGDDKPAAGDESGKQDEGDDDKAADKAKEKEEKEKKDREEKIKKFDETVEELTRTEGLFTTWHDASKLMLQLDEAALGREFTYMAALDSGVGSGALYRGAMLSDNDFVLHFEKRGKNKVVLLAQNTRYLDGGDSFDQRRRDESVTDSVIQSFDYVAEHPEKELVLISLADWFYGDNLQLARAVPGGKYGINRELSAWTELASFPKNLEIDAELVLLGDRTGGNLTMADGRGLTLKLHHSLSALPDPGFKPRAYDQRVGFFTVDRKDLLDVESKDPVRRYISRWRLQKKDPTAEVSDPVEPITYWIENSTPKKWREAVRKGIEAWEPAFRKAGFSNAIVAQQMPEDAEWDPGDVRYSVVRWSSDENVGFAIGPSRVDPRTGEIFDADITMQESFVAIYGRRYDTYIESLASKTKDELKAEFQSLHGPRELPQDADAWRQCLVAGEERGLEAARVAALATFLDEDFDRDAFLSAMIVDVVAHEVGHTLGLRHNFKASRMRDMSQLADVSSTASTGIVGSVMDYNAIVIAAPGTPQGEYFPSVVGPYDVWAVEYGYKEFGGNEEGGLRAIASRSSEPGLDYGTDEDSFLGDPYATTWDMSSDPVAFARSQIALAEEGFRRLADQGAKKGEGYSEYGRFYSMFSGMYLRSHWGLDRFVGGFTMNRDVVGQEAGRAPLVPIDPAQQRDALDVMCSKALRWTGGIPDTMRLMLANQKYGSWGSWFDSWSFDPIPRIVNNTRFFTLMSLMDVGLYEQLNSQTRFGLPNGLPPQEVADKVFAAVWGSDAPDEHDRWTQSDYVDLLTMYLDVDTTPDVTAMNDALLNKAQARCQAYAKSGDPLVKNHGAWLDGQIQRWRDRQKVEF